MMLDAGEGTLRPTPWPSVRRRLDQACGAAGGQLLTPDDAKTFIREYMRALFTGRRASDPDRFVRTFVAALSFTDIPSVEQFVHRYLLEPDLIDIADLRESIRRYREIQKTISDLNRRLDALRAIQVQIDTFDHFLAQELVCRGIEKTALLVEGLGGLLANLADRRAKSSELEHVQTELKRVEDEIAAEQEALSSVQRQLLASGAQGQRAMVEQDIKGLEREHASVMGRLQLRHLGAARAMQLLAFRDRLSVVNPGELIRALERVEVDSRGLVPPDWPRDPAAMDGLLEAVAKAAADRIRKVTEQRDHAIVWINNLEDEQAADREQLATARKGQIALHPATTRLMDALRREGMTPRTLCEVANVVDERWRHALESLLTRDREAVIVDPEHAYRATEILRHGRDAYPGCRVANTRKLQSRSSAPQAGTLASMIQSEDQLAMAFVVFRIGNVSLAEDQEELLSGGRAVMADGAYYDGLITEMRRPDGLKIGRAAAPLMEATLSERIARRVEDLKAHGERRAFFDDVLRRLEDCSRPVGDAEKLDALALSLGISPTGVPMPAGDWPASPLRWIPNCSTGKRDRRRSSPAWRSIGMNSSIGAAR
jgi:hypothetical protein